MSAEAAARALETVWRTHRLSLISALAAAFRNLDLAEDALSDALVAAQSAWANGLPEKPEAWLYRTAHNKGLDRLRGKSRTERHAARLADLSMHDVESADAMHLPDARLSMLFTLAHPSLSAEAQSALMLFHVIGLPVPVISRGQLTNDAVIHQRLKRAREKLARNAVAIVEPPRAEWPERLPPLLGVIELVYGYAHADLAGGPHTAGFGTDALQLAEVLAHLLPNEAEVQALAAMLFFCEARRPARLDAALNWVPLDQQDTRNWSQPLLARAAAYLNAASEAMPHSTLPPGPYAIRAQIQSCHTLAKFEGRPYTGQILALFDGLLEIEPSPVVAISRALVLADRDGAAAGRAALIAIEAGLEHFAPWHLAQAELATRLGEDMSACAYLDAAIPLITGAAERAFVVRKRCALKPYASPK